MAFSKKELRKKAEEYLLTCDNIDKDEWYGTDRDIFITPINGFLDYLEIDTL